MKNQKACMCSRTAKEMMCKFLMIQGVMAIGVARRESCGRGREGLLGRGPMCRKAKARGYN